MGWTGVVLALFLPPLAGAVWIRQLWPQAQPGGWPLAWGYGFVLGMVAEAQLLRLFAPFGLSMAFVLALMLTGAFALIGVLRWSRQGSLRLSRLASLHFAIPRVRQWLSAVILLWIALRFADLALDLWIQPLFPWDAWTTWTLRARAWFELGELVPFVSPEAWAADTSGRLYTIDAWAYPPTVSLIALWLPLAAGQWTDVAANLPWFGCLIALALGFYGQARLWGASAFTTAVFLWLMVSLPLLNAHVALAGYADLWLATLFGFAAMACLQWARTHKSAQGWLLVLAAASCSLIKHEGLVWMLLLVPPLLYARLGWRPVGTAAGLAAAGLVVFGWVDVGVDAGSGAIELPGIGRFVFGYHPIWADVWRNFVVYQSWHLFHPLVAFATAWMAIVLLRQPAERDWLVAQALFVAGVYLALYILFFWTDAYLWAVQSTSINRIYLHFVPALTFWMLCLWSCWLASAQGGVLADARASSTSA